MLALAAELLATETFWRRGVTVSSGQFQTHDHINVPGYFQWLTEQKPKDMNEGKGFIGRSVREIGDEINQNALYITNIYYII